MAESKWYTSAYAIVLFFVVGAVLSVSALLILLIPRTDDVLALAAWRMAGLDGVHVETNISYDGDRAAEGDGSAPHEAFSYDYASSGDIRHSDAGKISFSQDFRLDLREGEDETSMAGDYRHVDGKDSLTLREIPEMLFGLRFGIFRARSLRFAADDILSELELPLIGGEHRLTETDREWFYQQVRETPFLSIKEKMPDEEIRGVKAMHYKVNSQVLYARELLMTYESLRRGRELTPAEKLSWEKKFTEFTPEDGEIWIGNTDYFVHRLRLSFRRDSGTSRGLLTMTFDFSGFGEATSLQLPSESESESADIYVKSLFSGIAASLPSSGAGTSKAAVQEKVDGGLGDLVDATGVAITDSDDDGLSDQLEAFYGADALNPDTDGDGVKDGVEEAAGMSPVGPWRLFDLTQGLF